MPQKKPKSRKKVAPKRLQALAKARLFKDATYEARRPLGYTRSHEPDQPRTAQLHGSVVALTLLCACCTGGLAARWLVAAALPREHREETRLRDAHTEELVSFIICNGVVPARLKQQAPALPLTLALTLARTLALALGLTLALAPDLTSP